jgi:hypothetical protein
MSECYADTLLIETLVPTIIGYNHQYSCFKVEGMMKLGKLKDQFALGIVDNDKVQIKYLNDFEVIDKVEGSLILWRHREKGKHHYIIQICPALEQWLLNICGEEDISIGYFGINADLDALKEYTKSKASIYDKKLIALFAEINSKTENISVRKLKNWITQLKEKNYKADIKALQNG